MRIRKRHPTPADLGLTPEEGRVLRALTTPQHIQEFVVGLHANFEEDGDTPALGPRRAAPSPRPLHRGGLRSPPARFGCRANRR